LQGHREEFGLEADSGARFGQRKSLEQERLAGGAIDDDGTASARGEGANFSSGCRTGEADTETPKNQTKTASLERLKIFEQNNKVENEEETVDCEMQPLELQRNFPGQAYSRDAEK
jgi:hypothetical protein